MGACRTAALACPFVGATTRASSRVEEGCLLQLFGASCACLVLLAPAASMGGGNGMTAVVGAGKCMTKNRGGEEQEACLSVKVLTNHVLVF